MPRPLIAIDIDDTLADSTESLRIIANQRTGSNLPPDAYKVKGEYWGYYERVWAEHGIDTKYSFAQHKAEMEKDHSDLLVVEGAVDAVKRLSQTYQIVLITARDRSWEAATRRWLEARFSDTQYELHFIEHHHDDTGLTKGQLCKQLGVELLIDDHDAHCVSALNEGVGAIRFGTYGWHGDDDLQYPCFKTWAEVLEYLRVKE
jgi:5'(3')-deoxyribonucleotidase